MTDSATFLVDGADVPDLRNAVLHIARVGYSEKRVIECLGLSDISDLKWRALPIYRNEKLAERDVLALSIDLFLLQGSLPKVELDRLFDKTDQDVLVRSGLLSIDDKGIARTRASLFPVGDRLVFSDHAWPKLPHPGCTNILYDQVMSVGADSHWLARVTTRRPVESTLDLCTGSGVHALLAASHSQRVLAVDISPRAARCARFNVQASGANNVEIAIGDLYEPVSGEHFDLITANPPFVPSPVDSLRFRDGGLSGEDIQRRIIEGLPYHLAPGGIAQIVTELGERDDESIADRLRSWLGNAPIDILILRLREHSTENYAIGHAEGDYDFGTFLDSVNDWADNLKANRYSRIISVLLAFQWSDPTYGPPWTRSEETQPPLSNANTMVDTMFAAERMSRKPNLHEILEHTQMRRAGLIGLMEARVLGSELRANAKAQLFGTSLPIYQWLDPVEREILVVMEEPLHMSELMVLVRGLNLGKEAVFAAVGSLIQRGLVLLMD